MKLPLLCPVCGSDNIRKNGTIRWSKQNCRCRDCGCQFVEEINFSNPQWKFIDLSHASLGHYWNYFSFGALIVSGLTLALFLLSECSYWLMRFFFAVAMPVSTLLILLALVSTVATGLLSLVKGLRWKTSWKVILWVAVFAFSSFSFLGSFLTNYEVTASASFDNQKYYLIKFIHIDSYKYRLYSCEPLGLVCSRTSGYIGIPYQHNPIQLRYNLKTRKVYIQNVDQMIQIPNQ